ncbi:TPA: radical SAM protein [Campylobacter jejuni]|uniref:radical SAM/SPASM domain-containing protein n=1 Tax=Campylobacter jejuni TaxID=197 RepID=UPI000F80D16B|nr:radical SAM protein [Campylobacter jejuni]RTJ88859.1 radical SAM protein [Campylobacter jejuni]HED7286587.1 radical SAM protein [Campylobacter jejuni]HEG2562076.1 radical SAM protein [Campylobacter jejuni]HEG7986096.1 radical SAM protein [Campylobacter jejuni]HEG8042552.1 radical SAM protein [Campylobacter jejuni]
MEVDLRRLLDSRKVIQHYINYNRPSFTELELESLPPIATEFHWCSSCNYNCVHCSYGQRRKNSSKLSFDVIQKTIMDLNKLGNKAVYFSGGGEPTTLKDWEVHIKKVLDLNMEGALITNSVAIKPEHYSLLRRLNYIAVSVYSTKEDQYKQIVRSNQFEGQFLLPKKIKSNDSNVIVGARCVINSINYQEIFNTYRKAIDSGFDYIIFIPAVDYEKRRIDLTLEQRENVLNQIERNIDEIDPKKTNLLNVKQNNIGHYAQEYLSEFHNINFCHSIMMRTNVFINYDGEVYLCQPLIGNLDYSIGNINKISFLEIWNSDKHKSVIEKLNCKFSSGACENCRAIAYNKALERLMHSNIDLSNIPNDNFL